MLEKFKTFTVFSHNKEKFFQYLAIVIFTGTTQN